MPRIVARGPKAPQATFSRKPEMQLRGAVALASTLSPGAAGQFSPEDFQKTSLRAGLRGSCSCGVSR
jgi:hypothetical protein